MFARRTEFRDQTEPMESDELVEALGRHKIKGMDLYFIKQMCNENISLREKMKYQGNRLASYKNWPYNIVDVYPPQLVKAGLYYTGNNLDVVCFACEIQIGDWNIGDDAYTKHRERSPMCHFLTGAMISVDLVEPVIDESLHPNLVALKRRTEAVVKQVAETNEYLSSCPSPSENTNMTASMTPGQVMTRQQRVSVTPTRSASQNSTQSRSRNQNMGVTRGVIALRDEQERLKTYQGNWNEAWPISPLSLARAGFFYCGPEDMVQCAWCFGKLQGWEAVDDPVTEHAQHFPACPKFGDKKGTNPSSLVKVRNAQGDSGTNEMSEEELGIMTSRPCNPQYAIEVTRLESFRNRWPGGLHQTPDNLAAAGFFFVGYADNVKCFFCDGGLCNWENEDEPWTEHARWFPDCGFLKQVKGPQFIQKVREVGIHGGPVKSDDDPPKVASPSRTTTVSNLSSTSTVSEGLSNELKRELRSAMGSPSVAKALETGIPKDAVEIAIRERFIAGNGHFPDDESLINAALLVNDRQSSITPSTTPSSPSVPPPPQRSVKSSEGPSEAKKNKKRKNKETSSLPSPRKEEEEKSPLSPGTPMSLGGESSNGADAKSLEEENLKLKEQRLCKICMDEEVSIVLLPCGHLVACVKCAPALRNCPICRNAIKGSVRTFMV